MRDWLTDFRRFARDVFDAGTGPLKRVWSWIGFAAGLTAIGLGTWLLDQDFWFATALMLLLVLGVGTIGAFHAWRELDQSLNQEIEEDAERAEKTADLFATQLTLGGILLRNKDYDQVWIDNTKTLIHHSVGWPEASRFLHAAAGIDDAAEAFKAHVNYLDSLVGQTRYDFMLTLEDDFDPWAVEQILFPPADDETTDSRALEAGASSSDRPMPRDEAVKELNRQADLFERTARELRKDDDFAARSDEVEQQVENVSAQLRWRIGRSIELDFQSDLTLPDRYQSTGTDPREDLARTLERRAIRLKEISEKVSRGDLHMKARPD